mmetsp:Transcript_6838/g.9569  ORF Transcript_6838/g.9569 Transcript_6838/m.9569 type:complete len:291 (-) Transcript_6838:101-973(-)
MWSRLWTLFEICTIVSSFICSHHRTPQVRCSYEFSLEDLEALERELERNPQRTNRLGRECARYRWTQDNSHIFLTVPLPKVVPQKDVSLIISPYDLALQIIFAKLGEFRGINGQFAGDIQPEASRWEIKQDDIQGPSLQATLHKERENEFWAEFLRDEIPAPTVQFAGQCPIMSNARFSQHLNLFHVELDLPIHINISDISLRTTSDTWRLQIRNYNQDQPIYGQFYGRVYPDDTSWLLDDNDYSDDGNTKTLYIVFHKQLSGKSHPSDDDLNWWPSLSLPARSVDDNFF